VTGQAAARLPAAERRRQIVEAALGVFSTGSYAGATTAEIARAAGVSEPILYRHFASKRELYFACLDEAWARLRDLVEDRMRTRGPREAWHGVGEATAQMVRTKLLVPNLWMQAITEAGEDPEIRRYVRKHMRHVHDYVADIVRRSQEAGGVARDRDPDAEAWIFLGGTLLLSVADRLGGLLGQEDFEAIRRERGRWLSGRQ
jgi:AcrR family transcriptional regulator